jgi:hypothetical protein
MHKKNYFVSSSINDGVDFSIEDDVAIEEAGAGAGVTTLDDTAD